MTQNNKCPTCLKVKEMVDVWERSLQQFQTDHPGGSLIQMEPAIHIIERHVSQIRKILLQPCFE